jgi:hypothetical protein
MERVCSSHAEIYMTVNALGGQEYCTDHNSKHVVHASTKSQASSSHNPDDVSRWLGAQAWIPR